MTSIDFDRILNSFEKRILQLECVAGDELNNNLYLELNLNPVKSVL